MLAPWQAGLSVTCHSASCMPSLAGLQTLPLAAGFFCTSWPFSFNNLTGQRFDTWLSAWCQSYKTFFFVTDVDVTHISQNKLFESESALIFAGKARSLFAGKARSLSLRRPLILSGLGIEPGVFLFFVHFLVLFFWASVIYPLIGSCLTRTYLSRTSVTKEWKVL